MGNIFVLEKTRKTPFIFFDPSIAKLEIKGYSLPADSVQFYQPLLDEIDKYLKNPKPVTELIFYIEYFNSSSSKMFIQILSKFQVLKGMGKRVEFTWYYDKDDTDMEEAGKTFQSSVNLPTNIVPTVIE